MTLKPIPPTDALRATLIQLLTSGAGTIEPLFPGIPVYGEDEPETLVAPYITVDLSDDPSPWGRSALWSQRCVLRLVQPVAIPDDPSVSLDYDSSPTGIAKYEENFANLILGRWPLTGVTYNAATRSTYWNLSDLLTTAATAAEINIVFLDVHQIHRPDCAEAGVPLRAKSPISSEHELEFDLILVAAIPDLDL